MKDGDCLGIMTVKQAAEKWGITPRRVQEIIREGRINGVQRIGTTQVMPVDTLKPLDLRMERKKVKNDNETSQNQE